MRIGIGHDTHRLADGGPLRLGGVEIPFDRHLVGHSDADVVLHAVTDAILGGAAMGDIGEMFPDTDEAHRDRDSATILSEAYTQVLSSGLRVANLDCIIFAERPKLSPYKQPIRERLSSILSVPATAVNVKAKTGENVGPIGTQEVMMAECIVLLVEK
jgi:2-C-methyl-D-erythritol 2,4-cyclodiphosphate synthase